MQLLTMWKKSVPLPLNAHGSVLQCVCAKTHAKTYQEKESFGSLFICSDPHPVLHYLPPSRLLSGG